MPCLSYAEASAERLHQPLAHSGPDVDEAFLHHLHGIEEPVQLVYGDRGGARADEDAHVVAAVGVGMAADRQRDLRKVGWGIMGQITDQVRQRLAQLRSIDLDWERLRGGRDVELQMLAEA